MQSYNYSEKLWILNFDFALCDLSFEFNFGCGTSYVKSAISDRKVD